MRWCGWWLEGPYVCRRQMTTGIQRHQVLICQLPWMHYSVRKFYLLLLRLYSIYRTVHLWSAAYKYGVVIVNHCRVLVVINTPRIMPQLQLELLLALYVPFLWEKGPRKSVILNIVDLQWHRFLRLIARPFVISHFQNVFTVDGSCITQSSDDDCKLCIFLHEEYWGPGLIYSRV